MLDIRVFVAALLVLALFLLPNRAMAGVRTIDVEPLSEEQLNWNRVKVAAVQMSGNWFYDVSTEHDTPTETVDTVVQYIDRAGADKANLVVFPELLLGKFRVPSEVTEKISAAADRNNIYVIVGCFEVINDAGDYGNSSLIFDRSGQVVGRFFKMHPAVGPPGMAWPPKPDDPEWMMTDGDELPVFDLDFGRIGIVTCYDGYFPEPFRILSLKGAEIIVWMNARGGSVEDFIVKSVMFQNNVNMICTNKAVGAGTMIAQYPRHIVASVDDAEEAYIVGDLDLANLRIGRKYSRTFFQRAPEKYGEIVNDYNVAAQYRHLPDLPASPAEEWDAICKIAHPADRIVLTPSVIEEPKYREDGMREGEPLSRLSFHIRTPWMHRHIELRFPEVLVSDQGVHFMDHYRRDMAPLSTLNPWPQWQIDWETGALSYTCLTKEGLEFGGTATPSKDEVALEFRVTNKSDGPIGYVRANCCLTLAPSPEFYKQWDLSRLYAVFNGAFQPLSNTTPTPGEIGRPPWITMLRPESSPAAQALPKDSGDTWWIVEQTAEENLMGTVTEDGQYLLGYTWNQGDDTLMTNAGNPCLHTGTGASPVLEPGESHRWHGKIYLIENDPDELMRRYKADQAAWDQ